MTERIIELEYNHQIDKLFHIITNENKGVISEYQDITNYKQGEWINNKRKDLMDIQMNDIPEELVSLIKLFISDNNIVSMKSKNILLERTDKKIVLKIKIKLINKLSNIILKLFKYKVRVIYESVDINKTKIKIIYKIKSLISKKITMILDNYIENTLKPKYLKIFNDYLLSLEEKMI